MRANSRRDEAPILLDLREELEELKVLLRLCHHAKAFPNGRLQALFERRVWGLEERWQDRHILRARRFSLSTGSWYAAPAPIV